MDKPGFRSIRRFEFIKDGYQLFFLVIRKEREDDEYCIDGGNHAQFGDYGEQTGDGKSGISSQEQQKQTIEEIVRFLEEA